MELSLKAIRASICFITAKGSAGHVASADPIAHSIPPKVYWCPPNPSPSANIPSLPSEVLLSIFKRIVDLDDTIAAYKALRNASLVCRLWRHAAQLTLLKHVEIVREDHAEKLVRYLDDHYPYYEPEASPVETLAIGVHGYSYQFITRPTFGQLLGCVPRLQKLVILHTRSLPDTTFFRDLPHLTRLSNLVDVTIVGAGRLAYKNPELDLLHQIPESVKFLQVFLPRWADPRGLEGTPKFKLHGLTVPEYPSLLTTHIFLSSSETLQCLTVWEMNNISHLAMAQTRLRSLKVLGQIRDSGPLSDLKELERLELREPDLPQIVIESIPDTLRYLRFGSIDLARRLGELLTDQHRLPELRTVVWDYWFSGPQEKEAGHQVVDGLELVCLSRGIDLSLQERGADGHASQGQDREYEKYLRMSCFTEELDGDESQMRKDWGERPRFPIRAATNLHTLDVDLNPKLLQDPPEDYAGGDWIQKTLLEDSFENWHLWDAFALPQRSKDRHTHGHRVLNSPMGKSL